VQIASFYLSSPATSNPDAYALARKRLKSVRFVNFGLLDLELDSPQPEILVYAPSPSGGLRLGAVERAVPIEPWDALYDHPPMVLGQHLHQAPHLGLYILHAWVWQNNPAGMFEDWNPNVFCD
jgi:hypothetical protein